jgi:hypothetical protein
MEVTITKTKPERFFSFLETVSSLQPCTIEQIRKQMKSIWGPVRSARNFAKEYNLVVYDEKSAKFSLSTDGIRLMRYTGNLRNTFLVDNLRLQFCEPFASLQRQLSQKAQMTIQEIAEFLEVKFPQKKKWSVQDKTDYGEAFADWLVLLQVAKRNNGEVEYTGGEVKTAGIIYYPDMDRLLDRTLYDFLTESFDTPHNMLDEPYKILDRVNKTKDENEKGKLFESFIGSVFRRFGFSPRLKDGTREKATNFTLKKSGGGDVALFCHFPSQSEKEIIHGYAIACEGKATESAVGSKAVGQARNFSKKINELYPRYLVQPLIFSQSKCGYDESGRRTAPPEVVHLTAKTMLSLLDVQKRRLEQSLSLTTPIHIMLLLQELVKQQNLEPEEEIIAEIVERLEKPWKI